MNRANREFLKSAFARDLSKNVPYNILSPFPKTTSYKLSPSTKNTKTFLPKVNKRHLLLNDQGNSNSNNSNKEEGAPLILLDLNEEDMNKYFSIDNPITNDKDSNTKANDNDSNNTRTNKFLFFKSIYSNHPITNQAFYYSNEFSDYYKEDLRAFSAKFKLVQSRIAIKGNKLKNAIAVSKHNNKVLKPPVLKQIFDVTDKDVNHVNCSNDATSLVLKILNQINPDKEAQLIKHITRKRYYYRTNKPLGNNNDEEEIDYTVNKRYQHSEEIRLLRRKAIELGQAKMKDKGLRLSISTYDPFDKDLVLFNKEREKDKGNRNGREIERIEVIEVNDNEAKGHTTNKEKLFTTSIVFNKNSHNSNERKRSSLCSSSTTTNNTLKRTNSAIIRPYSFISKHNKH